MGKITSASAREYINALVLPPSPRGGFEGLGVGPPIDFNEQKSQAMVVASDIISFVKGVSAERRQDIVDSSLLAQLVANKKVPDKTKVIDWYNSYFDVLEHIGWVVQDKVFSEYTEDATGLEAHEAILKVATVLLGASPAALAVVTSTLEALKSMDTSTSWITIFDRESKKANTAHFQITLAEQAEDGQFLVSLMAFSLKAQLEITQVLFFKFRDDDFELQKCSGKVTINEHLLLSVRDRIRQKIAAYASSYMAKLPDLNPDLK